MTGCIDASSSPTTPAPHSSPQLADACPEDRGGGGGGRRCSHVPPTIPSTRHAKITTRIRPSPRKQSTHSPHAAHRTTQAAVSRRPKKTTNGQRMIEVNERQEGARRGAARTDGGPPAMGPLRGRGQCASARTCRRCGGGPWASARAAAATRRAAAAGPRQRPSLPLAPTARTASPTRQTTTSASAPARDRRPEATPSAAAARHRRARRPQLPSRTAGLWSGRARRPGSGAHARGDTLQ